VPLPECCEKDPAGESSMVRELGVELGVDPLEPWVEVLCDSAERSEPVPDELPLIPVAPDLPDCAAVLPPSACRRLGFRISTWQPQPASEHR
jgi:hypothetical protein